MRIQHNIMAMNAYRNYNTNTSALSKNLEKLSSGYKINRAGDDAAGLAISEKMRAQITGLEGAQSNAKDGISLVQTAEGALTEVHDMLNRMYELAEQSANGTYEDGVDRVQLQKEIDNLTEEIDRIADSSNFNGIKLLDGSLSIAGSKTVTEAATTGTQASLDLTISMDGVKGADGKYNQMTITLKHSASASAGASVTSDGTTIELTLNADSDYSADKIAEFIKNAKTTAVTDADLLANVQSALKSVSVTGKGVTAATGTGTAFAGGNNAIGKLATAMTDAAPLSLQIGDTGEDFNQLSVSVRACDSESIGVADVDISTQEGAKAALDTIKSAINYVSDVRGGLGAIQNRLDHTINNLSVMQENIQDAESSIRDTDIAEEMMDYTKNNILIQSAQAMLAQANQVPQGVLQLLQ